jgi:predicted GNAT family acetyltransferase
MKVQRYRHTGAFLDRATAFLLRAEAENNMLLEIGVRILDDSCYLVTVENAGAIVACAVRTPPYGLVITRAEDQALDPLIDDVIRKYETLPSVLGPEPTVSAFAVRWARRTGSQAQPFMRMRMFEARHVIRPISGPAGYMRLAVEAEMQGIVSWVMAFHEEASTGNPLDPASTTRDDIANERLFVWHDDDVVSIAICPRRSARSASIGLVYTPPAYRGRGYASALVASLTQRLLEQGAAFCCINTDLNNPTTNKIYPAIGYRPVCDTSNITLNPV